MSCRRIYFDRDEIVYGLGCHSVSPYLLVLTSLEGMVGEEIKQFVHRKRIEDVPAFPDMVLWGGQDIFVVEIKRLVHPIAVLGVLKRLATGSKPHESSLPWGDGWKEMVRSIRIGKFSPMPYMGMDRLVEYIRGMPEDRWKMVWQGLMRLPDRGLRRLVDVLRGKYISSVRLLRHMHMGKHFRYVVLLHALPVWLSVEDIAIFTRFLRRRLIDETGGDVEVYLLARDVLDLDTLLLGGVGCGGETH